jgi:EPS-associated MarR family transcriptional regulator
MFKIEQTCFPAPADGVTRHGGSVPEALFPPMADKALLNENTRFTALRLLQANPKMTQRELAQALGVSLGKANYCLKALLDKGLLKVHKFQSSQRKLAYVYLLTPSGIAEKAALTSRFLQYKIAEFEALKAEIESLQYEAEISQPPLQASGLSLRAERGNP